MSTPHSAMKHTLLYSCLQVPAEEGQPHSMSRGILELEVTCCPYVYFDILIQTRSAQLACLLGWITSAPDSMPIIDPIYLYMVHSVAPSLSSQATLVLDPTGQTHIGTSQTPWSCHPGSSLK